MNKPEKKYPYPFPDKEALLDYEKNYYLSRFDEGYNQCWDEYEKYHNEEIAKLKRMRNIEQGAWEEAKKYQDENAKLKEERSRDAINGQATMEECNNTIIGLQSQLNALKEEGEKDYKDMRRFQDKYIKADSELRVLREKVEDLKDEIKTLKGIIL